MQMVKRFFAGFFLALILLWLFSPKQELFYLLEKELNKQHIIISGETFKDRWIGFEIHNADIYYEGGLMASIDTLTFTFLLFYNKIDIQTITMNKALQNVAPKKIDHLNATYSVINPLKVTLTGEGSFGEMDGNVNLVKRQIDIRFPVAKEMRTLRKFLKKDKVKGWHYEKNY